jgi:hypothetical protein
MIYVDRRLLGVERIYHGNPPEDYEMRVSEEVLKSVCFICSYDKRRDEYTVGGTGFFVAWPGDGWPEIYLVTARHCVRVAQDLGDGRVHVLLNTKGGPARHHTVNHPWRFPEDTRVDLAAVRFDFLDDDDAAVIPKQHLLTAGRIQKRAIGIGDELWLDGLFWPVPGEGRMRPVLRLGTIAAMPDEPITTQDAQGNPVGPFSAYLVEVRSIGGLSGSPVWVHLPYGRLRDVSDPPPTPAWHESIRDLETGEGLPNYLLGVIRLHWTDRAARGGPIMTDNEAGVVNMGIAGVTPISELTDLLTREDIVKQRKQRMKDYTANLGRGVASEDFAPEAPARGPEPERLKINMPMDEAVSLALRQGKPAKSRSKGKRKR